MTACSKKEDEVINVSKIKLTENSYGEVIYSGEMSNNLPHGSGQIYIENDEQIITMIGYFKDGKFISGDLNIDYINGEKYISNKGVFLNGELIGNGTSTVKDGEIRVYRNGEFINGQLNGRGVKSMDQEGIIFYNINGLYEDDKLK